MPDRAEPPRASRCPICGRPAVESTRPFCGRRCADIDLNRWLSGVYAVPAADDDEDGLPTEPSSDEPA